MVEDNNHVLHKKLPYILDGDLNTCRKLPVPGDSPSMFWMIIRELSLFGARTDKLGIQITGENIECQRVGVKSVQVATSGSIIDQCDADANLLFCKFVSRTTNVTLTRCDIECKCADQLQCSYLHVVLQSANTDPWSICELNVRDL
ncbi:uncharacterized protein [Argopecten irradians]|uniref:uncharacterized protein n=1 Tax=Argopecten irradians TaxID=31199 RepID=UPI00371170B3